MLDAVMACFDVPGVLGVAWDVRGGMKWAFILSMPHSGDRPHNDVNLLQAK